MSSSAPAPAPATELEDLNADVVAEILVRLPCASVARCRAVCRAWRGITSSPGFVAAYSRRRPPELIVQRHGANGVLDTVPLATLDGEASRRRCLDPGYPSDGGKYMLQACCGDLLLFASSLGGGRDLWVCNPVTRRWSAVAPPHCDGLSLACGLYLHRPSGEHRLLFLANDTWRDITGPASHYVGSLEQMAAMDDAAAAAQTTTCSYRRLGPPALATVYVLMSHGGVATQCLDYDGKLHWRDHPEVSETDKILAFDTVSETFRRTMRRPPPLVGCLLEMDGRLAMATAAGTPHDAAAVMDLWVLEDYDSDDGDSWTCRHRIDLSALWPSSTTHPCCWAMDASALLGHTHKNVIVLGDMDSLSVLLYHVTDKRVLKRIQVVADKSTRRTHMSPMCSGRAFLFLFTSQQIRRRRRLCNP